MNQVPLYIDLLFGLCAFFTITLLYKAGNYSRPALWIMIAWMLIQTVIGLTGFYTITDGMPPRFILLIGPPLLGIICLFATKAGRSYIDSLSLPDLTLLHTVRIPVEIVLLGLYLHGTVPELMTFEGRNFDILSGLSAPLIWYFSFRKKKLSRNWLLAWNFVCLGLLVNIVVHAVLAAPLPFQKIAFEQPNIAVMHFPYVWLPCLLVPVVLLSHLASIRQLTRREQTTPVIPNSL